MKFEDKLKKQPGSALWKEYCGFLDLNIEEYMQIQNRLMMEQIQLWGNSGLGKRLLKEARPQSVEDFRRMLPLTSFADYADVLLQKRADMLPAEPIIWIETTWEGGKHPVKLAPYTRGMLDVFQNNMVAALILATCTSRGKFTLRPGDKTLYGLAPLPYVTGLFPLLLEEEITLRFLPSVEEALKMSFGQRNKKGFELGLQKGLDLFFGLSSVITYITEGFSAGGSGSKSKSVNLLKYSPGMVLRYLKASYKSKRDGVPMKPRDIFNLKGFICAGTDTSCYKAFLEENWGCRPMEIAAGTEPTCIGTESWARNGLIFFPDACFYEFIPESEMNRNIDDPDYEPKTCLMDELAVNQNYELVISVLKGGAFARYRVGDVYRCVGSGGDGDGINLPHLTFVDRVPTVIDIAGFTRITEDTIEDVVKLSGLPIDRWIALKEYNADNRPFLHMYVEIKPEALNSSALSKQILVQHLSVYFNYLDSDYLDLKRLLGVDPLQITILRSGTIQAFQACTGEAMRRINPPRHIVAELLKFQNVEVLRKGGGFGL